MERVPTWAKSPYLGMFQYKSAGPDRIHRKSSLPFYLPPSPYLGMLRHDQSYAGKNTKREKNSVGTQTDVCLTAYVIQDYH